MPVKFKQAMVLPLLKKPQIDVDDLNNAGVKSTLHLKGHHVGCGIPTDGTFDCQLPE